MHPRLFCILKNADSVEKDPRLEIIFNKFQLNLSFILEFVLNLLKPRYKAKRNAVYLINYFDTNSTLKKTFFAIRPKNFWS